MEKDNLKDKDNIKGKAENTLYLVSTPIGHLGDITLRALDVLKSVDFILCEDTRHSGRLLKAFGIRTPIKAYHDHSGEKERRYYIQKLAKGSSVALISDAGTPLISDPGYKLVRQALEENIKVIPVPGANAVLPALQLSGLGSDKFAFMGFMPSKSVQRKKLLEEFSALPASLIFYDTAQRLKETLQVCREVLGDRPAAVIREMTKLHESSLRDSLSGLIKDLESGPDLKGEIVVVIDRPVDQIESREQIIDALEEAMDALSMKDAVNEVSMKSGWRKKDIYNLALSIQEKNK